MKEGDRIKLTAGGMEVMKRTRKLPPPKWRGVVLRRNARTYDNCERVLWDHEQAASIFHMKFIEPA